MGKKKPFINKREARHFQVVHRSQRDPLYHSEEASPYVLKPVLPSPNLKKLFDKDPSAIPNPYEVDKDLLDVMEPRDLHDDDEYYDSDEYYYDEDEEEHGGEYDDADEGKEEADGKPNSSSPAAAGAGAPSAAAPAAADGKATRGTHFTFEGGEEEEVADESKAGRAALFGIFYDDRDYDYLQHLKPTGAPGAVFVPAKPPTGKKQSAGPVVFRDDDLPAEALPSRYEVDPTTHNQVEDYGLGLDLPEELREVLYALDDDAYVEDDDRYFTNLDKDEIDEDLAVVVAEAEAKAAKERELPEVLDWTMAARLKELHTGDSDDEDDDDSSAGGAGGRSEDGDELASLPSIRKSRGKKDDNMSSFSMSSSVLSRTSHLELLDDRFDQIEREYADEELGAVDVEAPPALNDEQRQYMNSLLDDFLSKHSVTSHNTLYENLRVQGGGVGQYDIVRKMLKTDEDGTPINFNLDKYQYVEDTSVPLDEDDESDDEILRPSIIEDKYEEERWDCESVLSTYSNLENHPKVISERGRKSKAKQSLAAQAAAAAAAAGPATQILLNQRTGLPKLAHQGVVVEKSDDEDGSDDDEEQLVEAVNLGVARSKNEDKEEKRMRKQALKEAKREKRAVKKQLKTAFKDEKAKQERAAVQRKSQAKGMLL
ncbi:hypothetical protein GGF31_001808 [Allomyces arbusculus]|nr:hypothetical protein GGF31_001808 [Allomyces arbusculus]